MRKFNRNKGKTRFLALCIIAALLSFLAIPSFALTEGPPKEEVVYVNLNHDGSVDEIYIVNSFELNEDGQIIDYGNYTAFRKMTSSGKIQMDHEKITIDAKAGKLYYEGTLSSKSIPWSFDIHYFLDKKEYPAHQIAGKSGSLEIKINIQSSTEGKNPFFEHYTLQAFIKMDTSICKNIKAKGATIANVGKNKQLAFTIFPGRETDISITTDVTDFEMEGISINGISMDMAFEFEDDPSFQSKVNDLKDGVKKLDDGAHELMDGTKELTEGTGELKDGIKELDEGAVELKDGTKEFVDGTNDLVKGTRKLNSGVRDLKKGSSKLVDGSKEINDGMDDLLSGAKKLSGGIILLDNSVAELVIGTGVLNEGMSGLHSGIINLHIGSSELQSGLNQLINQNQNLVFLSNMLYDKTLAEVNQALGLDPNTTENDLYILLQDPSLDENLKEIIQQYLIILSYYKGVISYTEGTDNIAAGMENLVGGIASLSTGAEQLKDGSDKLYYGIKELKAGTHELASNALSFQDGTAKLRDGSISLNDGIIELYDGVVELKDGTTELLDGTIELNDGSIKLDDGMLELSDGIIKLFDGAIELYDGTLDLHDGTVSLAEGTFKFRNKTATIDQDIKDIIKKKIDEMMGGDFTPLSFASKKNENINSVQFIMQTQSIEKPEIEKPAKGKTEKMNFWQRLLALFN
ncbi:MAG: hypothetical protein PHR60_05680 [Eubacteriales bacterium]|nr:hypothetical protein [Eubacteriales bacterium]MDD4583662.1 hypothetical protein [Eubacteriales bacterium]